MLCSLEPLTSLPIEDSGPGVSPRDSAVMVRKCEYLRPWLDTYQSASLSRTASFLRAGPSSSSILRASSKMSSTPTLRTPADRIALVHQGRERDLPALADRAQALAVGDAHVGEEHLVEMRGAGDLLDRADLDARRPHVDEEIGEPLVLRRREVGARHQHAEIAVLRARGPDLLAVDDPVLAVALGARAQAGKVGARRRLGEQLAPDLLAAQRLAWQSGRGALACPTCRSSGCTCRARCRTGRGGRRISLPPGRRSPVGWACRRARPSPSTR